MSFGFDGFAAPPAVSVEVTTNAYRIAGTIHTPFHRVAEILNQLPSGHLTFERATIVEHAGGAPAGAAIGDRGHRRGADHGRARDFPDAARDDMHIEKRPIRVQVGDPAAPPPRHRARDDGQPLDRRAAQRARPLPADDRRDGHVDAPHPHLDATVPVLAFRRDRAQVLVVADDDDPDELLADVLDEGTARSWLGPGEEPG